MKTNLFYMVLLMVLAGVLDLGAGVLRNREDGTTFSVEDWSAPESFEIPSGEKRVRVVRQQCDVLEKAPSGQTRKHVVERLFEPQTKELWLGVPGSTHLMLHGRIHGIQPAGRGLKFTKSSSAGNTERGEDVIAEEFFGNFVQQPILELWSPEKGGSRLLLERIFGDVVYPKGVTQMMPAVKSLTATASSDAMRLSMVTAAGHELSLTLNENLDILQAKTDGQAVLVLSDGRVPADESHGFGGFGRRSVYTPSGLVQAMVANRVYEPNNGAAGEDAGVIRVGAAVMADTGELWVGPSGCMLARLEGGMVGCTVRNKNELWIIRGQSVRISPPPEGVEMFASAIQKFNSEFESHQRRWSPHLTVNLSQIVQASGQSCEGWEFSLNARSPSFQGNSFVLRLNTSDSRTKVEVTLSADLKLQSSRVVKSE